MLRFGTISDVKPGFARVVFDDELQSDWLPLLFNKAATDSYFFMAEGGEYVACMMDEQGENGVILGAVYSEKTQPKKAGPGITSVVFSDGASVVYDSGKGEMTIKATSIAITGKLTVTGDIRAGIGPASVSLLKHTHPGPNTPPVPTP
jgi:phage baseplate assembly protein V